MDDTKQFILDNIRGIRVIEEVYELKFDSEKKGFDFDDEMDSNEPIDFYFVCLECDEEFEDLKAVIKHIPTCGTEDEEEFDDSPEFDNKKILDVE